TWTPCLARRLEFRSRRTSCDECRPAGFQSRSFQSEHRMSARYTLRTSPKVLAEALGVTDLPLFSPRFNVAPTQSVLAVRQREDRPEREGLLFRWGLIPSWSKDPKIGVRCLNARADTVADKPAFRPAFKKRRCLIAADGFYEWTTVNGKKQPWHIRMAGGEPFGFAGLWEVWHADDGEVIESCTIMTTEPNEVLRP